MNPEDVGRVLDEIGERIGPAGEYAWQLSVRQVWIEGLVFLVAAGAMVGSAVALVWVAHRHNAKVRARRAESNYYSGQSETDGIEWMGVIFIGLFSLALLVQASMNLLNPEYHAMIRLLERVVPR